MAEAATGAPGQPGPLDFETSLVSGETLFPALRRGFSKFLAVPMAMLAGFFMLGVVVYALDKASPAGVQWLHGVLQEHVFANSQTTGDFLGIVAGGLLTYVAIVISMLLIVLQQTAGNMGNLVYDHFMERRPNQVYVGYVTGAVVMAFFLQSTVSDAFNPVLGASLMLVVTFVAVALLAWFLYSTVNQMKPEVIVNDIHGTAMHARRKELGSLLRTRRESTSPAHVMVVVRSTTHGYVTHFDLASLDTCLQGRDEATEVVVRAIIGEFVSYRDIVAEVKSRDQAEAQVIAACVGQAFTLAREREPDLDARFNVDELEMMAWTEGSTSKQNPETTLMAVHTLRDLLRRWVLEDLTPGEAGAALAVVYPDRSVDRILDAFESLAVISAESRQHQVVAEVLDALALSYLDLPARLRRRIDSLLSRILPALEQHLYTVRLQNALNGMVLALRNADNDEMADLLLQARNELAETVGQVSLAGAVSGGSNGKNN